MAKRWSLKEDIIICKYCIENPWAYSSDIEVEWMKSRLEEAGCDSRSFSAVRKRAYAYELMREGTQRLDIPEQVANVFIEFVNCDFDSDRYRGIKAFIQNAYNPNDNSGDVLGKLSSILDAPNDLLGYKRTIDYKSTFPMVLQKYVDLKGIKKHNAMCKRIGMKPDTFSAILRGKYKEVKKDNVLKICVGLELHVKEAEELLESAGYMFSNAVMKDVIIKAFLWDRIYSVVAINAELYENGEQMLFEDYVIEYEV